MTFLVPSLVRALWLRPIKAGYNVPSSKYSSSRPLPRRAAVGIHFPYVKRSLFYSVILMVLFHDILANAVPTPQLDRHTRPFGDPPPDDMTKELYATQQVASQQYPNTILCGTTVDNGVAHIVLGSGPTIYSMRADDVEGVVRTGHVSFSSNIVALRSQGTNLFFCLEDNSCGGLTLDQLLGRDGQTPQTALIDLGVEVQPEGVVDIGQGHVAVVSRSAVHIVLLESPATPPTVVGWHFFDATITAWTAESSSGNLMLAFDDVLVAQFGPASLSRQDKMGNCFGAQVQGGMWVAASIGETSLLGQHDLGSGPYTYSAPSKLEYNNITDELFVVVNHVVLKVKGFGHTGTRILESALPGNYGGPYGNQQLFTSPIEHIHTAATGVFVSLNRDSGYVVALCQVHTGSNMFSLKPHPGPQESELFKSYNANYQDFCGAWTGEHKVHRAGTIGTMTYVCHTDNSCVFLRGSCLSGAVDRGGLCVDLNECATNNGGCDAMADCTNTAGSFECHCPDGYGSVDNGVTCEDIDECTTGSHNCDLRHGACINSPGTFECVCNDSYTSNNKSLFEHECVDIDECAAGTHHCPDTASCTNTNGTYTCACEVGLAWSTPEHQGCISGNVWQALGPASQSFTTEFQITELNGQLVGFGSGDYTDKRVWVSQDALSWVQVGVANAGPRKQPAFVPTASGCLLVVGGQGVEAQYSADIGGKYPNWKIYYTCDEGRTWSDWGLPAPTLLRRVYARAVLFNSAVVLVGGYQYDNIPDGTIRAPMADVWSSSDDGETWERLTVDAGWPARSHHELAVVESELVIVAGQNKTGHALNDVWASPDGSVWHPKTLIASWSARILPSVAVHARTLFLFGGQEGIDVFNDLWYSSDIGVSWYPAQSRERSPH